MDHYISLLITYLLSAYYGHCHYSSSTSNPWVVRLSWLANAYSRPVLSAGDLDLVFDVRSGFSSGSVHARLQVSVYNGYDLWHPGCPKIDSFILTPCEPE